MSHSRSLSSIFRHTLVSCTVVAALAVGAPRPVEAADSAKRREVHALLKLTGADQIGNQVMQQLLTSFQHSFPKVPTSYWNKLRKSLDTKELVDEIVPVYERHFELADIKALIAFYRSPVGKKFIRVQPQLVAESMQIGQAWGQKVAQRVAREVQSQSQKQ